MRDIEKNKMGAFRIQGTQVALDIQYLQEVVSLEKLHEIPTKEKYIVGAIELRGFLVPVIDFSVFIGKKVEEKQPNVVIVSYQGFEIGILSTSVSGVFETDAFELTNFETSNEIFEQGFIRKDNKEAIAVLNLDKIFNLPGLISTKRFIEIDSHSEQQKSVFMLLMKNGDLPFALSSEIIHTIIINPVIKESAMKSRVCEGVIEFNGVNVPVINLLHVCGMGNSDDKLRQAFVVKYHEGMVAFMVGKIIDVVKVKESRIAKPPQHGMPGFKNLTGVIPESELPQGHAKSSTSYFGCYFIIDSKSIIESESIKTFAKMNTPAEKKERDYTKKLVREKRVRVSETKMLTYNIGTEVASPIEDVIEVLPWEKGTRTFKNSSGALTVIMSRGRAIPVYCLGKISGMKKVDPEKGANILIVEYNSHLFGILVENLTSIDKGEWPKNTGERKQHCVGSAASGITNVGFGENERMLPVIELKKIAERILLNSEAQFNVAEAA